MRLWQLCGICKVFLTIFAIFVLEYCMPAEEENLCHPQKSLTPGNSIFTLQSCKHEESAPFHQCRIAQKQIWLNQGKSWPHQSKCLQRKASLTLYMLFFPTMECINYWKIMASVVSVKCGYFFSKMSPLRHPHDQLKP